MLSSEIIPLVGGLHTVEVALLTLPVCKYLLPFPWANASCHHPERSEGSLEVLHFVQHDEGEGFALCELVLKVSPKRSSGRG